MTGRWSESLKLEAERKAYEPRDPFPFYQRSIRLKEDFMEPYLRDLAKSHGSQKGLDPIGWAICRFMMEIADFQARRIARCEMLKCHPPEAQWIYRDLYQLDQSDSYRRIAVQIPVDAMPHYHADPMTWFLSWQYALRGWMGRGKALGRRPKDQADLPMMLPAEAYRLLAQGASP